MRDLAYWKGVRETVKQGVMTANSERLEMDCVNALIEIDEAILKTEMSIGVGHMRSVMDELIEDLGL